MGRSRTKGGKPAKARHDKATKPKPQQRAPTATRQRGSSVADLQEKLDARTRQLNEAIERENATAEVLRVISSSSGELHPVFKAMLENATRICGAKFGMLLRYEAGFFHLVASLNLPPPLADFMSRQSTFAPEPGRLFGKLIKTKSVIHVIDRGTEPEPSPSFKYGGARSSVAVPMIKDNELVGGLFIYRTEVRPFTDRQVELVQHFAAQAVIAIENTRLLNELRESLQQQTATADVLKTISRSAFDLQTVLDTLVESAVRLCEARFGAVFRLDDDLLRLAAHYNFDEAQLALIQDLYPMAPNRGHISGRAILTGGPVQIPDIVADQEYQGRGAKWAGFRSLLGVPLFREGRPIGAIVIYRKEAGAFADKQLTLLQTFADQAVIAIENVRLFDELQARTDDLSESLQQQTATADVLKVISRSVFNLKPVLETVIANACRLCAADKGFIYRVHRDTGHFAEAYNASPELLEFLAQTPVRRARNSVTGRVLLERRTVHVEDVQADPEYDFVQKIGVRTTLGVPMLREGSLLGVIIIYREEVRPFTARQIELVETFADQAVIAIENVRLFDEIQEKSRQLAEASHVRSAKMSRAWTIINIWVCSMRSASSMPGVIGQIIGRRPGTAPIPSCRRPWRSARSLPRQCATEED